MVAMVVVAVLLKLQSEEYDNLSTRARTWMRMAKHRLSAENACKPRSSLLFQYIYTWDRSQLSNYWYSMCLIGWLCIVCMYVYTVWIV